jgi:transcription initiation factor IIF auxiliary subunit
MAFVRGHQNENLSSFIEKVVFVLHSSFEEPEISKKTFQISSCFLATI